jgi:hypothetical protein
MKTIKFIDKFLAAGIVASIMLSLLLYFSGVDTISSLIIGLLGSILTLQIDQIARVEQSSERIEQKSDLAHKIDNSQHFRDLLRELISKTVQAENTISNDFFMNRAAIEIERTRDFMDELSKGRLRTGQNENDLILQLLDRATSQMIVISLASANDMWWDSPMGKKFWEANLAAIQRKLQIIRVFVFDKQTPEREKIMKKQASQGIKVFWVKQDELPLELRASLAIFDDKVGYQIIQTSDGSASGYIFTMDESDIRRMKRVAERVIFMSNQY